MIILQTVIVVFLAFWAYQEYVYNQYLQDYVNSALQGSGLLFVILGSTGAFAVVGIVLYSKLRHTRRVLETAHKTTSMKRVDAGSKKILEPSMEQQLMEMLRRTKPADSSDSLQMPVLNNDEPQASTS